MGNHTNLDNKPNHQTRRGHQQRQRPRQRQQLLQKRYRRKYSNLGVRVSRRPGNNGWEQVSQQAQEQRHILGDELREVHVPQRLHEQQVFILV